MESLYQICILWYECGNENFNWFFDGLFLGTFYRDGRWGILRIAKNESRTLIDYQSISDLLFSIRSGNSLVDAGNSGTKYQTIISFTI